MREVPLCSLLLVLSSTVAQAASIDGAWDCSESFAEGPLKVSSTLIQHYDSARSITHAKGQVQLYQNNQLALQFEVAIDGEFSLVGQRLTEKANKVQLDSSLPSADPAQVAAFKKELQQALEQQTPMEVLQLDEQQLQVKDVTTGEISTCQRLHSATDSPTT